MATQPILREQIVSFGEMRAYAKKNEVEYKAGVTEVDGAHIHSCYEIYVNVTGDISFLHGSTVYDIRPLDLIVSFPGDVHHCIYHADCTHAHYCIWFQSDEVAKFLTRRGIRGHIRLLQEDAAHLPKLLQRIRAAAEDPFLNAAAYTELFALLDRKSTGATAREAPPARIEEMLAYIDEHLTTIEGGEELARAFFVSKATVNRLFHRHVGIAVGKLIEAKRLSLAERLLRADASVTDACYRAGFSDCSRFIACFKKKFGQTPLKYKQELYASQRGV